MLAAAATPQTRPPRLGLHGSVCHIPFLTNRWPLARSRHRLIRTSLWLLGGIHESRPTLMLIMYLSGHGPALQSPIRYIFQVRVHTIYSTLSRRTPVHPAAGHRLPPTQAEKQHPVSCTLYSFILGSARATTPPTPNASCYPNGHTLPSDTARFPSLIAVSLRTAF